MPGTSPVVEPVGWRGTVAWAADDVRPEPLRIESCTFSTHEAARAWVEEARTFTKDLGNFACSVTPVYGAPF
jgi:hypothetical protein